MNEQKLNPQIEAAKKELKIKLARMRLKALRLWQKLKEGLS